MKVLVLSGSRADLGLLDWPAKVLREAGMLEDFLGLDLPDMAIACRRFENILAITPADVVLVLGDRWEIMAAATEAHLRRIPIAHIAGGDVSLGSYDDAMRDCISRMASIHFTTSHESTARLCALGYRNVHMVGNPAIDYIRHADWREERPIDGPYVVVAYYPETIDGTIEWDAVEAAIGERRAICIKPNNDKGSDELLEIMRQRGYEITDTMDHGAYLNLLSHCEEFIGNSSAMLYEAPELGIKTKMIGKRQRGRVIPTGDGHASERIRDILRYCAI